MIPELEQQRKRLGRIPEWSTVKALAGLRGPGTLPARVARVWDGATSAAADRAAPFDGSDGSDVD